VHCGEMPLTTRHLITVLLLACSTPVHAAPTDLDGDGVDASVDCNDNDVSLGDIANDADCDGSLTIDDCDDANPANFPGNTEICDGGDNDCDGSLLGGGSGISQSLTTTFADNNGHNGNIFDINALADAQITGFDTNLNATGAATIDIYWRVGTGYQSGSSSAGWTLLEVVSVTSNGTASPTPVPLTNPLSLNAGQTYSIQIISSVGIKYSGGSSVGAIAAQDANLQVTEGYGCGSLFSCVNFPRVWNGTIHYTQGGTTELDNDGDGYVECTWAGTDPLIAGGDDCDNNDPNVWPGNVERCDGIDNDCDVTTDENIDGDGDTESACDGDCDDTDDAVNTFAVELCDGIDNDCIGGPDFDVYGEVDSDQDGYLSCEECDDTDPLITTNLNDVDCDGVDAADDCDDTNPNLGDMLFDADCDGALTADDCDDVDPNIGAIAADADCDGSLTIDDCDDANPANFPGNTEICDGSDNDCDGNLLGGGSGLSESLTTTFAQGNGSSGNIFDVVTINELDITAFDVQTSSTGTGTIDIYWRAGTGYQSTSGSTGWTFLETVSVTGNGTVGSTYVPLTNPLSLAKAKTYSIQIDSSLGIKYTNGGSVGTVTAQDANLQITEGYGCSSLFSCSFSPRIWNGTIHYTQGSSTEFDADGDGYVECTWAGTDPLIAGGDDCDNTDPNVWPGNVETCDGIDNDCDVTTDENIDGDGDTESACDGDCDDTDAAVNTFAVELCDGIDNDCIGGPDFDVDGEVDGDMDGYLSCEDCDDTDPNFAVGTDDADCDGVLTADDCDDNNPNLGDILLDSDCDGSLTADDCDDIDPNVGAIANDGDCDGTITAEDCDDSDPASYTVAVDADCDDVLTADDCDDNDSQLLEFANDADCDGTLTADDCDDNDPTVGEVINDGDCDGVQTADDCDDVDPTLGAIAADADCDGVLTNDDCDDNDPASLTAAQDGDCDGILTADDCDDTNPTLGASATDGDCDGTLTPDDCDDTNPAVGSSVNDADCDGASTSNDCDDTDPTSTIISEDADCDTVLTADDCDDTDPTLGDSLYDADCDGVLTGDDCDDIDPAVGSSLNDADCDGVLAQADCNDTDATVWYADTAFLDSDGDTYGDPVLGPQVLCTDGPLPAGYSYDNTDCDDSDAGLWTGSIGYPDTDFDGYGDAYSNVMTICGGGSLPAGYVSNSEDCDDTTSSIRPKVAEINGDGQDQNCDGFDDAWFFEDFETGGPDPQLWATVNGDGETLTDSFGGYYSYALGGGGATLSAVSLDTTTCQKVIWAFYGKRGPDAPDSGDLLTIDYYDGSAWKTTYTWAGDGTVDSDYQLYWDVIPDILASHQYFAVEVSSSANGATGTDQFTIDDFAFGCDDGFDDGDGIPSLIDCDPSDPAHWSDCQTCIDLDGDHYGVGCDLGPDCDDTDSKIHPGATDPAGDGVDQDCDGRDMPTFYDDFETGDFGSGLWLQATGDVEPSSSYSDDSNANDTWSAKLGGGGGTLTTQVFDAAICTRFRVSYSVKRGPEPPDNGDNLVMAYQIGTGGYTTGHTLTGNGTSDLGFTKYDHYFKLTPGVGSDVSIRFTSNGSGASSDHYFLDNVEISCGN
jgi:hypothetical protein